MNAKSPITTHILDTSIGCPAEGVAVVLERWETADQWRRLAAGVTNSDGRWLDAISADSFAVGRHRLTFAVGDYFQRRSVATFYPSVTVEFHVAAADEHYHVPLLLNPFGYTTYRGS